MKVIPKEAQKDRTPNRICIFGESGHGKTMSISTLPEGKVLFLDFERKASRLINVDKNHEYTVLQFDDWSDVKKATTMPEIKKLMLDHDFLVVDSLTYLRDFCIRNKGMTAIMGGAEVMDSNKSLPFYNFLKEQLVQFINDINNLTDKPIIYLAGIIKNKLGTNGMDVGDTGSIEIPRLLDFLCPLLMSESRERLLVIMSSIYNVRLAAEEELLEAFPNKFLPVMSDLKSIENKTAPKSGLALLLTILNKVKVNV